jgi:hypothetical protein
MFKRVAGGNFHFSQCAFIEEECLSGSTTQNLDAGAFSVHR